MASYEDLEKEFSSLSDDIECWKDSGKFYYITFFLKYL